LFDVGSESILGQVRNGILNLSLREHLNAQVIDRARFSSAFNQNEFQWWFVEGEVGVARPHFGRFTLEEPGVEIDRFLEVRDIQR